MTSRLERRSSWKTAKDDEGNKESWVRFHCKYYSSEEYLIGFQAQTDSRKWSLFRYPEVKSVVVVVASSWCQRITLLADAMTIEWHDVNDGWSWFWYLSTLFFVCSTQPTEFFSFLRAVSLSVRGCTGTMLVSFLSRFFGLSSNYSLVYSLS